MTDGSSLRGANIRLLLAGAAMVLVILGVPWLVGPMSAAMVPECPPSPTTDRGSPPAPSVEAGTGAPTSSIPPAPAEADWDLFGAPGGATGGGLFGGGPPPSAAPDGSPAGSSGQTDGCAFALPDDLPSAIDLILATLLSLLVGLIAAVVATALGATLGLLSGYRGGGAEQLVVRGFANGLDALPQFVLLVTAAALYRDLVGTEDNTRLVVVGVLIGLVNSTQVLLIVHHQTRLLTTRKFVIAARLMGWGPARVIRRKILPHLRHELIIPFTQLVVWGLFMETALSYIGFSPTTRWPTLGTELYRLEPFIEPADLGPAIVMCAVTVLLALALRAIGDAVEDRSVALDALRFAPEGER